MIMSDGVLLDTSYLIRLLNRNETLHENALGYHEYFLKKAFSLKVSTISIAEYCVKGDLSDLPMKQLAILPFNINHAAKAGKFAKILFQDKQSIAQKGLPRVLIPNDAKLLAQAEVETDVIFYVTADTRSKELIDILRKESSLSFRFIDIHLPWNKQFGERDLFDQE